MSFNFCMTSINSSLSIRPKCPDLEFSFNQTYIFLFCPLLVLLQRPQILSASLCAVWRSSLTSLVAGVDASVPSGCSAAVAGQAGQLGQPHQNTFSLNFDGLRTIGISQFGQVTDSGIVFVFDVGDCFFKPFYKDLCRLDIYSTICWRVLAFSKGFLFCSFVV